MTTELQTITLGGCFWCTEAVYVHVIGVLDVGRATAMAKYPTPVTSRFAQVVLAITRW